MTESENQHNTSDSLELILTEARREIYKNRHLAPGSYLRSSSDKNILVLECSIVQLVKNYKLRTSLLGLSNGDVFKGINEMPFNFKTQTTVKAELTSDKSDIRVRTYFAIPKENASEVFSFLMDVVNKVTPENNLLLFKDHDPFVGEYFKDTAGDPLKTLLQAFRHKNKSNFEFTLVYDGNVAIGIRVEKSNCKVKELS